jgi:hypothetical protein
MPMVTLLQVVQRTEDNKILINHSLPNPLIALDLLLEVQKTLIHQAGQVMELKKESAIITHQEALIT